MFLRHLTFRTYRDRLVEADRPLRVAPVRVVVLEVLLDLLGGCRVLFEMSERFGEEGHQVHEARRWRALLYEYSKWLHILGEILIIRRG